MGDLAKDVARRLIEASGTRYCYKCHAYRTLVGGGEHPDARGKLRWMCAQHQPGVKTCNRQG